MSLNIVYPMADAVEAEAAGAGFGGRRVMARFEELVQARAQQDPWLREHPPRLDWVKDLIPFELPEGHPFLTALAAVHRRVLGTEPEVYISPGWSDGCYLPRFCSIPTLVYGAGTPGKSHSADEYAEVARIVDCSKVLAAVLYATLKA